MNYKTKLEDFIRARPALWGQEPSFIVHHTKDCGFWDKDDGECDCDPDVELESVEYQKC